MKNLILSQYRTALSKSNAMYVFERLYFEYSEKHQTDDTATIQKAKVQGFKILRKLGQYSTANELLKIKL